MTGLARSSVRKIKKTSRLLRGHTDGTSEMFMDEGVGALGGFIVLDSHRPRLHQDGSILSGL